MNVRLAPLELPESGPPQSERTDLTGPDNSVNPLSDCFSLGEISASDFQEGQKCDGGK